MAMRRSASEPISHKAMAMVSAANATGSAWKLPPEMTSLSRAKTSGLSVTPFASRLRVAAACRRTSSTAPMTCGWQRTEYGSCTRSSPVRCDARMALPPMSARKAAATSICPRCREASWMRGSKGPSEPRTASVVSAPVTRAAWKMRSASNRPARASAVETCVPLSKARPSLAPSASGSRPARCRACAAGISLAVDEERADAHQGGRHMGERREIAGRRRGALAGDDRRKALAAGTREEVDRGPAHARGSLGEAGELQRHRQTNDRAGEGLADAGCVRQDEVALQGGEIDCRDAHAGELAEAGRDPVDGLAFRDDGGDRLRALPRPRSGSARSRATSAPK